MDLEIRKHYPAKVEERQELPYEEERPKRVKRKARLLQPKAMDNTTQLVKQIIAILEQHIEAKKPIAYHHLFGEIMVAVKLTALKVHDNNIALASRMLGLKRTTFREALRLKGLVPKRFKK